MRSREKYSVGSLEDWLTIADDEACSVKLLDREVGVRLEAFTSLLAELYTKPVNICAETLGYVLSSATECVLCIWVEDVLVATAQASLMFSSMQPTVHISNVVVTKAHRGKGFGEFVMRYLKRQARIRWQTKYGQLRFMLTSQEKRNTRVFYEKLGYAATPTIRYER